MLEAWLLLALTIVLIALNGFFVAAEFAFVTVDRPAVRSAAESGDPKAESVLQGLKTLSTQLSGCQLGITITSLVIGYIAEPSIAALLRPVLSAIGLPESSLLAVSVACAFALATISQMVFSELVPKNWALAEPMRLARWVATPQRMFSRVTAPLLHFFNGSANVVVRLFGITPTEEMASGHSIRELGALAHRSAQRGTLQADLAEHMEQSAELGMRFATDAMTPRARVHFLDSSVPVSRMLNLVRRTGHSRFPVTGEDSDDILGAAHFKDALRLPPEERSRTAVGDIIREIRCVPASMPLDHVLAELRGGLQLAVVVDEFGGTDGIITLEDLMEELVGEITDESDNPEFRYTELSEGAWQFSGLLRPDEIRRLVGIELPEGRASETIGGLLTERLEHFPELGETCTVHARDHEHLDSDQLATPVLADLSAAEMDGRRVALVNVTVRPFDPDEDDEPEPEELDELEDADE